MNSFGEAFRITLFGESHGSAIGIVADGVPCGLPLSPDEFITELNRRRSGERGTTERIEDDTPSILSGISNGYTTGAPIAILFENRDTKPQDYKTFSEIPRPGHADFVSINKYRGFADMRGGGRFSGRITIGLVAAGVIAKKIISPTYISAEITRIGGEDQPDKWDNIIETAIIEGDSVGGVIECRISNVPIGLGEPFFNSLESTIAHLIFAIPGIRGIEFGDGFKASDMRGSEHNDPIINQAGECLRNGAGGINGGISNGNDIIFRAAVKPTSSIKKTQQTYNFKKNDLDNLVIRGRHDSCFALRVPVIIESVAAIVIADHTMLSIRS